MPEKAIIVGCILNEQIEDSVESSLDELSLLAQTAKAEVVFTVTQKRDRPDPRFYIGKGKAEEIHNLIEESEADLVIFNDELSPSQLNRLENILPCKVIDRTQLILDIFAMRARSKEGKLQVEWAQLQYLLPRIMGRGTSLSRLGGGIGTRGPGETKLEMERRHIRRRMSDIEKQLDKIVSHRDRYRQRRKKNDVFQVTLVGYTNAGKSTLLNQLTNADSYTEDQLFATLDPTTKQLQLPSGLRVLVSDTVGFIQDLPTSLIAAFRSTLEEVKESDLILHVIDSTSNDHHEHNTVVLELINELGAGHIPLLKVYNKRDLMTDKHLLINKNDLFISAHVPHDLEQLKKSVEKVLVQQMVTVHLLLPSDQAQLIASCRKQGIIHSLVWQKESESYYMHASLYAHHSLSDMIVPYRTDYRT